MIWLGSEIHGHYVWLGFFSVSTAPLFFMITLFMADQSQRHSWIRYLGAGMMAWVAGSLFLDMPSASLTSAIPPLLTQTLVALLIMTLGFAMQDTSSRRAG
jgi:predicted tellurium resistance membrane protein TerC